MVEQNQFALKEDEKQIDVSQVSSQEPTLTLSPCLSDKEWKE
ncbi:hypothetical protein [Burkholderia sp. MS455]|nr:hypothetical protein [Burkholderia sp. MS455]